MGELNQNSYNNTKKPLSTEDKIFFIQAGDERLREEFINNFLPLIKKFVAKACRHYVDCTMDEFSVGLIAFNEAIDQFRAEHQSKFLSFAYTVIRRRIIDFIRNESKQKKVMFAGSLEDKEVNRRKVAFDNKEAMKHFEIRYQNENLVYEIQEFKRILSDYGITLKRLINRCPKQKDARQRAKEIGKMIAEDEYLSKYLQLNRKLPLSYLDTKVSCCKKTIERQRVYIIAIALIYLESLSELKAYIRPDL